MYQIILDTNVVLSALRSKNGASFRLLTLVPDQRFEINLSVALVLEYESVLKRPSQNLLLSSTEIDDVVDFYARIPTRGRYFIFGGQCSVIPTTILC